MNMEKTNLMMSDGRGVKRNCGYVVDGAYRTNRDWKNIFKKFGGFGISTKILGVLNSMGIETIEINFCDHIFRTSPLMYCASGCDYYDESDKQKVLNLNLFDEQEHQNEIGGYYEN